MKAALPHLVVALLCAAGCASSPVAADGPTIVAGDSGPGHTSGMPGLGAHALKFYEQSSTDATSIATPTTDTQSSGSTIIVSVGRGIKDLFSPPTDNKGNSPYQQIDSVRAYDGTYPDSGTALYAFPNAKGGSSFQVNASTSQRDEITLAFVEVVESTRVVDHSWKLLDSAPTLTSGSVTTTGPATLVAFWWGTGDQYDENIGDPGDGFTRIDYVGKMASLVQCSVAVKNVTAAGSYTVSWTSKRQQGAQLWLVAVQ